MNFDEEGRLVCTPPELYEMAVSSRERLLNAYLMVGTPRAFPAYARHYDFLEAVSERTGVHIKNLYVRGSCHIGFSIAPDVEKIWSEMAHDSDLDLVIVDAEYFYRCEDELRRWELRNPPGNLQKAAKAAARRAQDRQFNLFRDKSLPGVVCVHHRKTMEKVAALAHCGHVRGVSAFIYPDWHSAQNRYEYDLKLLCEGVAKEAFSSPPPAPLPRQPGVQAAAAAAPGAEQPAAVVGAAPEQPVPPAAQHPQQQPGPAQNN